MNAGRQADVQKVKCSNMHMGVGTQYRIKKIESAKVQAYKQRNVQKYKCSNIPPYSILHTYRQTYSQKEE